MGAATPPRVAARLGELVHNVAQGGQTDFAGNVAFQLNLGSCAGLAHQLVDGTCGILRHLFDQGVAFGVDGALIEGVLGIANAQEAGALLEGFGAQTGHAVEFLA